MRAMIQVASYRFRFRERTIQQGTVVFIDVHINGKRWRHSTGLHIPKGSLSSITGRLKSSKGLTPAQAKHINQYLAQKSMKAERIFLEHADQDIPLTLDRFKRAFNLPSATTLREFAELHIEKEPYKYTTIQQLRRAVDLVEEAYNNQDVTIYDLEQVPRTLEKHMVKLDLSFNTRQKYQGRIKTLMRSAIRLGYKIPNPYEQFRIHRIKGNRLFLEADELERLIRLYGSNDLQPHLQASLETFLFSCFTGLRYSDVISITHKNIHGDELHFWPVKGQRFSQQLRIPLPSIALEMISGREGRLFKQISDQKLNVNVKRIMKLANIQKHITFHCARHTFGTLFIAIGGELMVLKELMGHAKISTTTDYVKMANGIKKNQIKLFDERFGTLVKATSDYVEE